MNVNLSVMYCVIIIKIYKNLYTRKKVLLQMLNEIKEIEELVAIVIYKTFLFMYFLVAAALTIV